MIDEFDLDQDGEISIEVRSYSSNTVPPQADRSHGRVTGIHRHHDRWRIRSRHSARLSLLECALRISAFLAFAPSLSRQCRAELSNRSLETTILYLGV
jgi:hypothetical protein